MAWPSHQLVTRTLLYPGPEGQRSYDSKNKYVSLSFLKTHAHVYYLPDAESGSRHHLARSSARVSGSSQGVSQGWGPIWRLDWGVRVLMVTEPQGRRALASGCLQVLDRWASPLCLPLQVSPPFWSKKAAEYAEKGSSCCGESFPTLSRGPIILHIPGPHGRDQAGSGAIEAGKE